MVIGYFKFCQLSGLCQLKLSEKGQALHVLNLYYGNMTEQKDPNFANFAHERVGSMPAPFTEGVDGAGKTIQVRIVGPRDPNTGELYPFAEPFHNTVRIVPLEPNQG